MRVLDYDAARLWAAGLQSATMMMMNPEHLQLEGRCPISGTHRRLHQAHLAWHQAERDYQNPEGFYVNLNATIQALRSVTFVLQKEKEAVLDFESWYTDWQERLRGDALMKWLVEARNRVEKHGDLDTHSSARISLLSGWHDAVLLAEATVSPLLTMDKILQQLPDLELPGDVQRHGVLLIERRWVVKDLPDRELLEALAHCYGVLSALVVDAHKQCGFVMRTFRADSHEHKPVRTEHLGGRLPCMVATRGTRTAALHLGTGHLMTFAQHFVRADPKFKDEVLARYGSKACELALHPDEDLIEASARFFEAAKRVLVADGYHLPMLRLVKEDRSVVLQALAVEDRQTLYMIMREVADQVQQIGAVALIHAGEFWMSRPDELKGGQLPSDLPTRKELLQVLAATCDGRRRVHHVEFSKNGEGKVELGKSWVTDEKTEGWWGFLEPVRQVWKEWPSWKRGEVGRD